MKKIYSNMNLFHHFPEKEFFSFYDILLHSKVEEEKKMILEGKSSFSKKWINFVFRPHERFILHINTVIYRALTWLNEMIVFLSPCHTDVNNLRENPAWRLVALFKDMGYNSKHKFHWNLIIFESIPRWMIPYFMCHL